jgi:hypothetical protein
MNTMNTLKKNGGGFKCSQRINNPASYKTPAVLLIYAVKSDQRLGRNREKNKST